MVSTQRIRQLRPGTHGTERSYDSIIFIYGHAIYGHAASDSARSRDVPIDAVTSVIDAIQRNQRDILPLP